jgi:hypothetical protein
MRRNDSSAAARDRWFTVSLTSYRPESSVWTWLAVAGLVGAIALAIVGIPSIDIHGPLHYAGIMDPFCGATRSVYLTMRCQFDNALRYNPGAPLLLLVAAGLVFAWRSGVVDRGVGSTRIYRVALSSPSQSPLELRSLCVSNPTRHY